MMEIWNILLLKLHNLEKKIFGRQEHDNIIQVDTQYSN